MDLRAFRFFNKPIDIKRLYSGLDKAMEFLNTMLVDIYLKQGSEHTGISVNDICYVKRENRRTTIATINDNYVVKDSWDEWVKKLTQPYFYIVHNSFIINVHHVTKYDYSEVYVNGDSVVDALDVADVEKATNSHRELSGNYRLAGDNNRDDVIDVTDYQAVVNMAVDV